MSDDNRISASITAADIAAILTKIQEIRGLLPFMISLSDEGRKTIPKLGDKTMGFHEKAQGYMVTNPDFIPGFTDMAEVNKDAALRAQLMQVYPELKTLFDAFEDTLMVVGSELYMADLAYYQSVKQASKRNRAGAQVIYNDLAARFPGKTAPVPPPLSLRRRNHHIISQLILSKGS
jgi:hypothetical protein